MLSIIVAIAENNVIGRDNKLLWHISADLKHFKALTSGHTVIMGRKTYESLPFKPLKNRRNIVISRTATIEGVEIARSLDDALQMSNVHNTDATVFVIGGAEIYRQALPVADQLYVTRIYHRFEGDAFFPEIDQNEWMITDKSPMQWDAQEGLHYSFYTYRRK